VARRERLASAGAGIIALIDLLASGPVSDIEGKTNRPPDISHPSRGQGCDEGTDFPLRNSLQVVTVDCAIPSHAIGLREKDFGRDVADRACNGGDSYFAKVF
jgi:hypothetical protein